MCIHPHYPVTWIRRVRLLMPPMAFSAGRFKSYFPYLLSRKPSQPVRFSLWRWWTRTPLSHYLFVKSIINAPHELCQGFPWEYAEFPAIYGYGFHPPFLPCTSLFQIFCKKKYSFHLETVSLAGKDWRTSTPVQCHVEEVSPFLLRRKNDDH